MVSSEGDRGYFLTVEGPYSLYELARDVDIFMGSVASGRYCFGKHGKMLLPVQEDELLFGVFFSIKVGLSFDYISTPKHFSVLPYGDFIVEPSLAVFSDINGGCIFEVYLD